jgi:hypothetical protein
MLLLAAVLLGAAAPLLATEGQSAGRAAGYDEAVQKMKSKSQLQRGDEGF